MQQSDEELMSILHLNGYKVTPQRLAIYRYLHGNESHPSADIIYADIKKELPTISQGTVYNTLSMFSDIGVIKELKIGNGHSRYDSNTDTHINIICPDCDSISDYHSEEFIRFWNSVKEDMGGEITGQRFDVYRKCSNCTD